MSNSKREFNRRKFIRNISLGVVGTGLAYPAFSNDLRNSSFFTADLDLPYSLISPRSGLMLRSGLSYFNTGSLGPSPKVVFDKVCEITKKLEQDPVGNNWGPLGKKANAVREQIANYINADKEEIILTRNTTEGMNLIAGGLQLKNGDEVLTSTDEHYGGVAGWEFLEKYHGVKIKKIEFPKENITTDQVISIIQNQISPRTKVCSLMDVSTITGMRMPMKQIAEITKSKGILLICDGAQSAGMLKVDVKEMEVDTFAASGHKWMLGPKETGFLYIKKEVQDQIKSIQLETGYKAYNHNTGTRNVANIIGLGEAIHVQESWGGISQIHQHNISLGTYLRSQLKEINGLKLITPEEDQLVSGITSVILKEKNVKEVYSVLKQKNIVVKKLGKRNIMRFSTHIFNTQEELDNLVMVLSGVMK